MSPTTKRRKAVAIAEPAALATGDVGLPQTGLKIGQLDDLIGYALRRAQLRVFEDANRVLNPLGLRPTLLGALIIIDANPGSTQAEISTALGIRRPNYVALMDELESRGLAERFASVTDKRSNAVFLTTNGRKLLRKAMKVALAHENNLLAALDTSQKQTLMDLLRLVGSAEA
jgi:DNA-binding MarR family transcriptional regulator